MPSTIAPPRVTTTSEERSETSRNLFLTQAITNSSTATTIPASGRTGLPAGGPWRTVSVAAASCAEANAASTAAVIAGVEAPGWLAAQGLPARLVRHDGRGARTCGRPEADGGAAREFRESAGAGGGSKLRCNAASGPDRS